MTHRDRKRMCTRGIAIIFAVAISIGVATEGRAQDSDDPNVIVDAALFEGMDFRMIGPSRGGRVTAVAGHRDIPRTFYMGATGGGVWKTTDNGANWSNISDGYFSTGSIGSIDVADSDADVVFVGTGSDGIRSNVIVGKGVYKSTDGGETWNFLGLRNTGQIGAVVVHPTNPDVVYVAALGSPFGPNPDRGIYKTVDGGESWDHVLFVSEKTGGIDLELNPANPDVVYAALWTAERKPWTIISGAEDEDGFYKSSDGGANWRKVETGLPQGLIGKIDLAVTPADPSRIYALVEAPIEEEGLYRSNDRGDSWRLVSDQRGIMNRPFYYTNVDADPVDADIVWVNNEGFYRSTDAGQTFQRRSTPHGDNHDMWINPDNSEIMIQSNDGGANVTLDGGTTWSTQRNQPTAELYQIHVDDRFPYWVYAGQQDNSTIAVPSNSPGGRAGGATSYWESIGGCETGPAVPRPGNANIVYSNCKGRFGRYSRVTGQEQQYYVGAVNLYGRNPAELPYRFQRVVPIEVSPHNPDVIYHGSQFVHRTRDEGKTWENISPDLTAFRQERQMISGGPITRDITGEEHYSVLYVIEESPLEAGVIWAGANDGPVHVTRDNGETWTDVTPPAMPPEGRIQSIEPSPHQSGKAYIAGYRYLLNDFRPYIYRTSDYGASWTLLTGGVNGIPEDYPTRVVREDPDREGLLYAGTDFGLFISFDDGVHWQSFQLDLPVTPVTDIKVHQKDLVLSTMGRSFWILDDVSRLHQLAESVAGSDTYFFQPRNAYRLRSRGGRGGASDPEYPVAGVRLDYFLVSTVEAVLMEFLDSSGSVIREIKSVVSSVEAAPEQGMRGPFNFGVRMSDLSGEAGMHRFVWDMRHTGALDKEGDPGRGPLVVPGTYSARFTVGDWGETRSFDVLVDPRVEVDGVTQADMEAQLSFNLMLRELTTKANQMMATIEEVEKSITDLVEEHNEVALEIKEGLDGVSAAMETDNTDSYPPPMLLNMLGYLSGMTSRADQRPGQDAYVRFDQLRDELDTLIVEVEQLEARAGQLTAPESQ